MSEVLLCCNCWEKEHVDSLGKLKHNEMQSKNMQTYYLPGWLNNSNQMEDRNRGFIFRFWRKKMTLQLYLGTIVPANTCSSARLWLIHNIMNILSLKFIMGVRKNTPNYACKLPERNLTADKRKSAACLSNRLVLFLIGSSEGCLCVRDCLEQVDFVTLKKKSEFFFISPTLGNC